MSHSNSELNETSTHGASNILVFALIAAPIHRNVYSVKFGQFLKERERYELQMRSKQAEAPSLKVLPYSARIDRTLLKNIVYMGLFDTILQEESIETLTDEHIKTYLHSIGKPTRTRIELVIIERAVAKLKVPMGISDTSPRVTLFVQNFSSSLKILDVVHFVMKIKKRPSICFYHEYIL